MLTQNQIKQETSYLYLHAIAAHLGYSLETVRVDMDSVDATICSRGKIPGSKGTILSPKIDVQLKTSQRDCSRNQIPFQLSKKNYDDLRINTMVPKILIVLFLPMDKDWFHLDLEMLSIYGKGFWKSLKGMKDNYNESNVTIYLDQNQRLTDEIIRELMIAAANREDFAYVSS